MSTLGLMPRSYDGEQHMMMRRATLLVLLLMMIVVVGRFGVQEVDSVPIKSVRVAGDFRQLSKANLEKVIADYLAAGFFRLQLEQIREAMLVLPWVQGVSIRRVWPDSVHVAVIERKVVAQWREGGLLASDGTLFYPLPETYPSSLPVLSGAAGTELTVLGQYRKLSAVLAQFGSTVRTLSLTPRGTWYVECTDGMTLVLGNAQSMDNLDRFFRVLPGVLEAGRREIDRVDLRYAGGFAVRWKNLHAVPGLRS